MDEDNEQTIIQDDIESILQKYKIYDPPVFEGQEDFVQQKKSKFEISDDETSCSSEISYSLKKRISQKFEEELHVAKTNTVCDKIEDNSGNQFVNFEDMEIAKLLAKYADSECNSEDTVDTKMYYREDINTIGACTEDGNLINNISNSFQMQISDSHNCKNAGDFIYERECSSEEQPINLSGDSENALVPTQIENKTKKQRPGEKRRKQKEDKEEAKKVKEIKKILATANKNLKPEESLKFVTVHIDNEITSKSYGKEIIKSLQDLGVQYQMSAQLVPRSFTWSRKEQNYFIDDDGKISLTTNEEDVEHVLLLMEWDECVQHVKANTLLSHIQGVKSIFPNKRISLMIYGLEGYFRHMKKNGNKTVNENPKNKRKSSIDYIGTVKVSHKDMEYSLTELQLLCSCCYRFIECESDLGLMVSQFTKSIAQAPYKLEKEAKHMQAEWYMSGDNKDCVRVDKEGNGLGRLWQQQLMSFPLVRLETAEAILSLYPTLSSLFEAYDKCETENQMQNLLKEIPIRRGAGPLTASQKIGPELSKKIYAFFNSDKEDVIL